jgi:hypothetical protein
LGYETDRTVWYIAQVWLGYWIMLLVMSYEALIFIAIVCGLSTGYFVVMRANRVLDRQEHEQVRRGGGDNKLSSTRTSKGGDSNDAFAVSVPVRYAKTEEPT